MDIISREIKRLQDLIVESDKKLDNLTGEARTKELYTNGNLHLQLRKIVKQGNRLNQGFYCSVCGDKFRNIDDRNSHSLIEHKSMVKQYGY